MKPNRPSRTAQLVALGRAIADTGLSHVPGFRDPAAHVFLSERGKRSLAKVTRAARKAKPSTRVEMARGMADLMALRTTAIDTAVRDAVAAGETQLVILGAGDDGRAWRMSELDDMRVVEVDRPVTQYDKRASGVPPARCSS